MSLSGKEKEGKAKGLIIDGGLYLLCLLFFSLLFILFIRYKGIEPIYENVDDFFLKQLSSGELTGEYEIHLRYISLISGSLLALLYKIDPSKTWYGFWLIANLLVSYSAAVWVFLKECLKRNKRIILVPISLVIFLLEYISFWSYSTYFVQYTTVTIIVAAAALLMYLTKHPIGSTILFILAMLIRINAAIMMLPFLFAFWAIFFFNKEKRKGTTTNLIFILAGFLLIYLAEIIGNQGVWKDHIAYDRARQTIVDYSAYPDYEENEGVYREYGISYEAYKLASTRDILILDEGFNRESMEALASLTSRHDSSRGIKVIFTDFIERSLISYDDRPFNLITYSLYVYCVISCILLKKKEGLGLLTATFAARMVVWLYLLFINRAPTRITIGLYIAENLILLAIILKEELYKYSKRHITVVSGLLLIAIIVAVSLKWGIPHMKRYTRYVYDREGFIDSYKEMRNYFYEHEDTFFLLDTDSFRYFVEPLMGENEPTINNYVYMGCWPGNTPWTDRLAKDRGFSSYEKQSLTDKNMRFVFMNTEATGYEIVQEYYNSKYDSVKLVEMDRISTTTGLEFIIVGIENNIDK